MSTVAADHARRAVPPPAPAPGAIPDGPTARAHRHGRLVATIERRRGRGALTAQEIAFPAGTVRLTEPDGDGVVELQQTAPSGGLLGGDRLEVAVRVGADVDVSLVTQGATRVYRPADGRSPTQLRTALAVADGARVEWVPHHLLLYRGAHVHQRTAIDVDPGGGLLAWEALSAGRTARGERFAWAGLDTRLRVTRGGGPLVTDGAVLDGGGEPFDGADLCVAVVAVLPRPSAAAAAGLADELHDVLTAAPGVLGSASVPAPGCVVARVLGRDAPSTYRALHGAREAVRAALGLPRPARPIA
ncbi:urease accessory protein UreD [Patulibacter brassicae]|uniref:Urease accessory protein UreD n=1 Tax=Patulibacter brassicae TaxID=1705717 RepID=A0ABU4VK26_9ACTN|nr:urease accessory protein UreD [Patulibacter brassicae]MDX8152182.1 urease accessory protein UreD [Patulibacter brassicae]